MTLSIAKLWTPSTDEWDAAWRTCPYSTYFHSRDWAEIWSAYTDGRIVPSPLGVALSDGTQVILPFSKERRHWGLSRRYVSSPAGTFGGWLAPSHLDDQRQQLVIQVIAQHYRPLIWRFNPFERPAREPGLGRLDSDTTHVLDLTAGFDEILRGWTKGHASAARKARSSGVTVRTAATAAEWETYFDVYRDSIRRWGRNTSSSYTQRFFDIVRQRASPDVKLWLAVYDDRIIAGALCFYSPTHAVYWHGAALSHYFNLRPVNLLMFEAIQDAVLRGSNWFDFNPSGGHKGVAAFKKSFGADEKPCPVLYVGAPVLERCRNTLPWLAQKHCGQ